VVLTLADMEGNETFDASCLGTAEEVVEERVADDKMVGGRGWVGGDKDEGGARSRVSLFRANRGHFNAGRGGKGQ
jgi:hypothetical protein